jgi:hypothetical protein
VEGPEPAVRLFQFLVEVGGATLRDLVGALPPARRAQVETDVAAATELYRQGDRISLEGEVLVVSGTR